jgi:hypothetical protein
MRYKFTYDKAFLDANLLNLSSEEVKIILATVIGNHNAIFWGYKPERLADAVKRLTNIGSIQVFSDNCDSFMYSDSESLYYLKYLNKYDSDTLKRIEMNSVNNTRQSQFIATMEGTPTELLDKGLLKNFDVIFKCTDDNKPEVFISTLRDDIRRAKRYRRNWASGEYITGRCDTLYSYWYSTEAWDRFISYKRIHNENIALKLAKVARSLADIEGCSMSYVSNWLMAKSLYTDGEY